MLLPTPTSRWHLPFRHEREYSSWRVLNNDSFEKISITLLLLVQNSSDPTGLS
jgi:hypothetical protein